MLIGWGLPIAITGVSTVINYTTAYVRYGEGPLCLIGDRNSLYAVSIAPVALSVLVNVVAFCVTTFKIYKSQRKVKTHKSISYFRIGLGIYSITGVHQAFYHAIPFVKNEWVLH
jgi:hypothetical protein